MLYPNFLKTSLRRMTVIISVLFIILGYIGYEQSRPIAIQINENRVYTINNLYDKIQEYKQANGTYPLAPNGSDLSKIFNLSISSKICYEISPDGKQFIIGYKLTHDRSVLNRMKTYSGVLYKNFYYDTILPRGSMYNDFYFEASGDYFTLSKIKEVYSHLEEK